MDNRSFYIVGIGASAGGQQALQEFFEHMPEAPNAAFIVVTHLRKDYRTKLHTILERFSRLPVILASHQEPILNNHVYVMPENVTLVIDNNRLLLEPRDETNLNRAINRFFTSLAEDQGEKAIGVVLSGSGTDGAEGIETIHQFGGKTFIQTPASSAFGSMPRAAINADDPVAIEPPCELAKALVAYLTAAQP